MNMKLNKIFTDFLLSTIIIGSCVIPLNAKSPKSKKSTTKFQIGNTVQHKSINMVNDAKDNIQKQVLSEKHSPFMISRTYEKCGDTIVVVTKVHHKEYRKKPSYHKDVFASDNFNKLKKTKFIYRDADRDHITQINENDRQNSVKIDFNLDDTNKQIA